MNSAAIFLVEKPGVTTCLVFVFIYLPHDYNNYEEMPKKKMWEEMARRPKGNYRAYVN